jgi:hypothetical protein
MKKFMLMYLDAIEVANDYGIHAAKEKKEGDQAALLYFTLHVFVTVLI